MCALSIFSISLFWRFASVFPRLSRAGEGGITAAATAASIIRDTHEREREREAGIVEWRAHQWRIGGASERAIYKRYKHAPTQAHSRDYSGSSGSALLGCSGAVARESSGDIIPSLSPPTPTRLGAVRTHELHGTRARAGARTQIHADK